MTANIDHIDNSGGGGGGGCTGGMPEHQNTLNTKAHFLATLLHGEKR